MKRLVVIVEFICILLVVFGLAISLFSRTVCRSLCPICLDSQLSNCFYTFLFVAIIFIVVGYSLHINVKELFKLVKNPKNRV
jgi:hypothetical protein